MTALYPPGMSVADFSLPHGSAGAEMVIRRYLGHRQALCLYLRFPDGCWRYHVSRTEIVGQHLPDGSDPALRSDYMVSSGRAEKGSSGGMRVVVTRLRARTLPTGPWELWVAGLPIVYRD